LLKMAPVTIHIPLLAKFALILMLRRIACWSSSHAAYRLGRNALQLN